MRHGFDPSDARCTTSREIGIITSLKLIDTQEDREAGGLFKNNIEKAVKAGLTTGSGDPR
jgi:hypothetical protein